MIQVYTGGGKGKTTASLGLAFRALGHGWQVLIIQFLKKGEYGEVRMSRTLDRLTIEQYGSGEFVLEPTEKDKEQARKALARAFEAKDYPLVILDEILGALSIGLLTREEVEPLLDWPSDKELVLTGRDAPDWIIERADLVSEIKEIKHPYRKGIPARPGIEF